MTQNWRCAQVTLGITMMWKLPLETDDEEKQPGAETGPWRRADHPVFQSLRLSQILCIWNA